MKLRFVSKLRDYDHDIAARFWRGVARRSPGECWEWLRSRSKAGYGNFTFDMKVRYAHRVAMELVVGRALASREHVCHRCDNRGCVNPNHLFIGTAKDNMADCAAKRRTAHGERNGKTFFTEDQILEIRLLLGTGMTQRAIGMRFGVSQQTISSIATGRAWKYMPVPEVRTCREAHQAISGLDESKCVAQS